MKLQTEQNHNQDSRVPTKPFEGITPILTFVQPPPQSVTMGMSLDHMGLWWTF